MVVFDNEGDIINYLMTVDFEDVEMTSEESKDLLNKFRYYYRKAHSETIQKTHEIGKLEKKITTCENKLDILEKEVEMGDVKFERLQRKKLSWKERISGKIFK